MSEAYPLPYQLYTLVTLAIASKSPWMLVDACKAASVPCDRSRLVDPVEGLLTRVDIFSHGNIYSITWRDE